MHSLLHDIKIIVGLAVCQVISFLGVITKSDFTFWFGTLGTALVIINTSISIYRKLVKKEKHVG